MTLKEAFDSKKQINAWACFYIMTLVAVTTMSRRGVGQISTALTLFAVLVSATLSLENVFLLIVAIIPWGQVFKIPNSYTAATLLVLVFIVKSIVLSNKAMFHIEKTTFRIYASYFVCLGISIIVSLIHNSDIMSVVTFFLDFLFVIVGVQIISDKRDIFEKVTFLFVISTILVCFCSTLFPALSRSLGKVSEYTKANPGFSSLWDFGRLTLISIAFIVVDYLNYHEHVVLKTVGIAILLRYMIQSGRFSILLGLACLLACLPFITKQREVPIKRRVFIFIGMLLLFVLLLLTLYFFFYQDMVALRGVEASDNGRFEVWKTYIDYLAKKPSIVLLGIGGGAISSLSTALNTATAHNILLEKLVEFGVVGLVLVVYLLVRLYNSNKDNIWHNLYLLPVIAFLGTSLTQGTTGSLTFAILIVLCMCKENSDDSGECIEGDNSNLQESNEYEDTTFTQ